MRGVVWNSSHKRCPLFKIMTTTYNTPCINRRCCSPSSTHQIADHKYKQASNINQGNGCPQINSVGCLACSQIEFEYIKEHSVCANIDVILKQLVVYQCIQICRSSLYSYMFHIITKHVYIMWLRYFVSRLSRGNKGEWKGKRHISNIFNMLIETLRRTCVYVISFYTLTRVSSFSHHYCHPYYIPLNLLQYNFILPRRTCMHVMWLT